MVKPQDTLFLTQITDQAKDLAGRDGRATLRATVHVTAFATEFDVQVVFAATGARRRRARRCCVDLGYGTTQFHRSLVPRPVLDSVSWRPGRCVSLAVTKHRRAVNRFRVRAFLSWTEKHLRCSVGPMGPCRSLVPAGPADEPAAAWDTDLTRCSTRQAALHDTRLHRHVDTQPSPMPAVSPGLAVPYSGQKTTSCALCSAKRHTPTLMVLDRLAGNRGRR